MITVTTAYYLNTWGGIPFDGLESLLARAEKVISSVATVLPECAQQEECYKNAVCAQAEQIGLAGGIAAWLAQGSGGGSFSIGSFSMSGGSSSEGDGSGAYSGAVCTTSRLWLEKGGLTYRGADAV